jgi:aryl-alcohol dehydrogenase-like predicted oxidoreductase
MNERPLPRRSYRPGVEISMVGLGGLVVGDVSQEQADRTVARAVEAGVNYFDVAPTYGHAEERLGPALAPFRDRCFLAGKTEKRRATDARAALETTLKRLRTDHLDLYQLHGLTDVARDVDAAFARGGAMEALIEARQQGRARFLGFSAHTIAAAETAMDRFDFDSILMPVHFVSWYRGHFGPRTLERAKARGLTCLAIKAMAFRRYRDPDDPLRSRWAPCWYEPLSDPRVQELAVRFTLDRPVAALVPPGRADLFWRAVEIARAYRPLTEAEHTELQTVAAEVEPIFAA